MLAGVELRKERRLGEVLTDSFNILFAYWRQLAIIAVPVVVAYIALSLVVLAITQDFPTAEELENSDEAVEEALRLALLVGVATLVALPILVILQQLVTGAAVAFLDEVDRGNAILPAEALDQAQARLGALVGATLRATFIFLLMACTIIGIPWAINRFVRWAFISQVIMVEGLSGQAVLARSAELVQGRWWNTLGRMIVVGLVIQIPINILQQALLAAAPGVIGTILSSATGFITVPFGIIALSLMFFDLRSRKAADGIPSPPAEPAP